MAPTEEEIAAHFEKSAQLYEDTFPFMEYFARHTLSLLPPVSTDAIFHDNACGPGIITESLVKRGTIPHKIHATDLSDAMIRVLQAKNLSTIIQAEKMDVTALSFPDSTFTHSVSSFVFLFLSPSDANAAAKHIFRTLKPGGVAAVTTWGHLGYMDLFQEVGENLYPDFKMPRDVPIIDSWKTQKTLVDTLEAGGFDRSKIEVSTQPYRIPGEVWARPGFAPVVGVVMSAITNSWKEEEKAAFQEAVSERLKQEKERPTLYTMVANTAVARK